MSWSSGWYRLTNKHFLLCKARTAYPEIIGVHVEDLTVKLAQVRVGRLDAVQVIHCLVQSVKHDFAMGGHIGVPQDGSYTIQISKFAEIALSPGIDDQHSAANKKRSHALFMLHYLTVMQCVLALHHYAVGLLTRALPCQGLRPDLIDIDFVPEICNNTPFGLWPGDHNDCFVQCRILQQWMRGWRD